MAMSSSRYRVAALCLALAAFLVACDFVMPKLSLPGSLSIAVANDINARTAAPSTDMNPANYTIAGTGPNGASFTGATTGGTVTKAWLPLGSWTIVVNAVNAGGALIGTGTATATVSNGTTTAVAISVLPVSGNGSLTLTVDWPAAEVQAPAIVTTLTPALGSAQSIAFVVSGATASYSNPSMGDGYYSLAFTLLDDATVVAGAVDVIRIVAGQATSGSYSYSAVNAARGSLQLEISGDLKNPLLVGIVGASSPMYHGAAQVLTANVSNYAGATAYGWYVNGVSDGAGGSYSFGANRALGYYRVDAVALSADGSRAGSATASIQVTAAGPTLVDLGTAAGFAILSATSVGFGSASGVTGNVGLAAASSGLLGLGEAMDASNGFSTSALVVGKIYAKDYAAPTLDRLTAAAADMATAASDAAGRTAATVTDLGAGELGGQVLAPGLYKWNGAASITTDVTLNGGPSDVWIF